MYKNIYYAAMDLLFEDNSLSEQYTSYAKVSPEQSIDLHAGGLTYGIPESLGPLQVGQRVIVPLGRGNKPVSGFVLEIQTQTDLPTKKIKAILDADPHRIVLQPDLVELAKWMANYYCCPLGMVFATMLPAAVKKATGQFEQMLVGYLPNQTPPKLSQLQQKVWQHAKQLHDDGHLWIKPMELAEAAGAKSLSPVTQLIRKSLLKISHETMVRASQAIDMSETDSHATAIKLNDAQQKVRDAIVEKAKKGFGVHLIHGVTGSGKTEVYLQIIEQMFNTHGRDMGVVVLVPEISLTPQTVARFTARFEKVAVLHSALTDAQRHEQWRLIDQGKAKIVVGARSAIFAPLKKISLIIVDEEHDASYKQDQLPRYHGRDLAIKRAHLLNATVVLGSATPSLESYCNATVRHRYDLHTIPNRVAGLKLPKVQIVNMTDERRHRRGVHLISRRLEELLTQTIDQKGQAMFLLNRRGYANYIACPDQNCGWLMGCKHCDVTAVYHKEKSLQAGGYVQCHHCQAEQLLPKVCPVCRKRVTLFGLGTQRVEEELKRKFPDLRFLRMDSDSMKSRTDYHQHLETFRRGEVDLLLGTQMIAKGLDFPNVRLVGVISGDTSLNMPDFRASERTFQLIAQVAGRAGRAVGADADKVAGLVIVQTYNPDDPTIQLASQHDYQTFAQNELAVRKQVDLPPYGRMARIVVRHRDHLKNQADAQSLADCLQHFNQQLGNPVRLRGPMPCPIARVADYFRQQIELVASDAASLQKLMAALRNAHQLVSDARTAIDVDPVQML